MAGTAATTAVAILEPPRVKWKHIDGPYLMWAVYGHWLTYSQQLRLFLRLATVEDIANEVWPQRRAMMSYAISRQDGLVPLTPPPQISDNT